MFNINPSSPPESNRCRHRLLCLRHCRSVHRASIAIDHLCSSNLVHQLVALLPWSRSLFAPGLIIRYSDPVMEEQFILRVPPSIAERIERLLNEGNDASSSSEDKSLDLSFSEDGRSGTFVIGNEHFPASLLDLPCVVESYKTYDDNSLIKTADIGQMIMVRESGDAAPDVIEYRHGLTPPMRDARKRRFRREPDLNPELVSRVEKDLLKIMARGTADNLDVEAAEQDEGDENARGVRKKPAQTPAPKNDVPETNTNAGEPDRSDSDESDDSV